MLGKPSWSRNSHEQHQQGIKEDRRAAAPTEEGAKPMLPEDKPVAPPESQEMLGKEKNPGLADEVYIPDYVMLDFGSSGTSNAEE
jgi:hypothetical protein